MLGGGGVSGRKAGTHGPTAPLRVTLPPALVARILAWGQDQGVPPVKGKPNLSGAIARLAEGLPEVAGE